MTQESTNVMVEVKPHALPDKYAKLGVTRGYDPYPPEKLRMFIVGPSGGGKTTFMSGCPRNLILDFEGGAPGVINQTSHRVHIPDYDTLMKVLGVLKEDAKVKDRPFDRVTFDTIDQFVELMNPILAAEKSKTTRWEGDDITEFGTEGSGWAILKNGVWNIITGLQRLGYTWAVIGHITTEDRTIGGKSVRVPRPVLFPSFARLISRNSEVFSCIYSQPETVQGTRMVKAGGRDVQVATSETVIKVYMDATTTASENNTGTGKLRGVPIMTERLELPDPSTGACGWEIFTKTYLDAVDAVRKSTET